MLDQQTSRQEGNQVVTRFPEIKYPNVRPPEHMASIMKLSRGEPPFLGVGHDNTYDTRINSLIEQVKNGESNRAEKNFESAISSLAHLFPGPRPDIAGPVNVMVYKPEGTSDSYRVLIQGAGGRHLEVAYGELGGKTQVKYIHLQDASQSIQDSNDPTARVVSDTTIRYSEFPSDTPEGTTPPRINIVQNRHITTDAYSADISYEQGQYDSEIKVLSAAREVHKGNHKERFRPLILPTIQEQGRANSKIPSWVADMAHKLPPDNTANIRTFETISLFPAAQQKVIGAVAV